MMELFTITADAHCCDTYQWPFLDFDWSIPDEDCFRESSKWESRHNRRMANKARKGAARLGQKRQRNMTPVSGFFENKERS
jgi:hypothetical protein